jgi:hypothetical protein
MATRSRLACGALALCGLLLSGGCDRALPAGDYMRYAGNPENGLVKEKHFGAVGVRLKYLPAQVMALNDLQRVPVSTAENDSTVARYSGAQYFNLEIKVSDDVRHNLTNYGVTTDEEYQNRLNYLSFRLQRDIRLIEGGDTLAPTLFHFERGLDFSPYRSFMVAFDRRPGSESRDKTFVLDTPVLSTGPVKLTIAQEEIASLPSLKL